MKFSDVDAVRVPNGNVVEIRSNGLVLWDNCDGRYVSFGDSIAAGHTIDSNWERDYGWDSQYGSDGHTSTVIVPGSYTDLIRDDLVGSKGNNIVATSYAVSGHEVEHLIGLLDHDEVRKTLSRANYVTLCIGANDVLQPALMNLERYIEAGDSVMAEIAAIIESNLAILADDNNANSYKALFDKLNSINPNAKYVFMTIYNPYKYLWLDEGKDGFFGPFLNWFPDLTFGIPLTSWQFNATDYLRDGFLNMDKVQMLFDRVNGLCDWSESFVTQLNTVLRNKINAYGKANFMLADAKAVYDTYPDRPVSADVHYNDLVHVEFTRGYNSADMDWALLWRTAGKSREDYFYDLVAKHLYWINALPSVNPMDYVDFDWEGYANDIIPQISELLIVPNVDPHPKHLGHDVLRHTFESALGWE